MDLFTFISWALVIVVAVTVIWPLNIALVALAYKVRHGGKPIPLEPQAFWLRSTFAALGLCLLSGVVIGLAYLLIHGAELPSGPVHLVLLLAYLPIGVWFLFWMFALEDLVQGLGLFLVYILLPGLPLLLLHRLIHKWQPLAQVASWLQLPMSS